MLNVPKMITGCFLYSVFVLLQVVSAQGPNNVKISFVMKRFGQVAKGVFVFCVMTISF